MQSFPSYLTIVRLSESNDHMTSHFVNGRPSPSLRQFRQIRIVDWFRLLVFILPVLRRFLAFGFVFGEFGLFPAAAVFGADAVEEFAGGFDVWVGGAPVGGQITTEGGGQHRLPELLQQRPHFRKRLPRPPTPLLQRLDLRHNPLLLGERWYRQLETSRTSLRTDMPDRVPPCTSDVITSTIRTRLNMQKKANRFDFNRSEDVEAGRTNACASHARSGTLPTALRSDDHCNENIARLEHVAALDLGRHSLHREPSQTQSVSSYCRCFRMSM